MQGIEFSEQNKCKSISYEKLPAQKNGPEAFCLLFSFLH